MTREEFLKKLAFLGLVSPFMTTSLSACVSNKPEFDVIESNFKGKVLVIGAGAAGITAGHILNEAGIDFEIVEASSIHGGRVKKLEGFADFPIDIGGEWLHKWIKARPPVLDTLMGNAELDFPTFKDKPNSISVWKNGELKDLNWMRFLSPDDYKFINSTWFDFLDYLVTPAIKEKIRYNAPVTSIDYTDEKVSVMTGIGEQYLADKVLITVPLKILQNGSISFTPELPPAQIAAIMKEQMPSGLKVFIEFSERFYPDMLVFGSLSDISEAKHTYYDAAKGKNSTHNVLGLFAIGEPSQRYLSMKTDKAIGEYILKELDEIFEGKASKTYLKHEVQNWSDEPFIQGSYSQRKGDPKKMAMPVANKVYFAGEAMNIKGHTIAIHGACESSYLALNEMLIS